MQVNFIFKSKQFLCEHLTFCQVTLNPGEGRGVLKYESGIYVPQRV